MIIEAILGYKSSWRIIELMVETPIKSLTRKEIRKHTRLGNEAINKALERLALADIIVEEKKGRKESYYFNTLNPFCQQIIHLIQEEKRHIKNVDSNILFLINEFVRKTLEKVNSIQKIFLFGSVAKGTAKMSSDIDIAIITNRKDTREELAVTAISDQLQEQWQRKVEAHFFTKDEFSSKKTGIVQEIKKDGIDILTYNKKIDLF